MTLLHNLTSNIEENIVELGNREGLGILSIYDALSKNSELYTLDIVDDVRFINNKIKSDSRVHILNDFNQEIFLNNSYMNKLLRNLNYGNLIEMIVR